MRAKPGAPRAMVDVKTALKVAAGEVGEHAHEKPKPLHVYDAAPSTDWRKWFRSGAGVEYETKTDEVTGDMIVRACQDVYQILEANQAAFTSNDGYSADKSIRRVGSIPALLRNKVLVETGGHVDLWRPDTDPVYYKRFMNDPDYRKLRTAPGRI